MKRLNIWDETREIEVEFEENIYYVTVQLTWEVDPQYGRDADGNRSITRDILSDMEVINIEDVASVEVDVTQISNEFMETIENSL